MNRIERKPEHFDQNETLRPIWPKLIMSLLSAAFVPSVAIFILVLFFLISGAAYSIIVGSEKFDLSRSEFSGVATGFKSLIGVTCLISAYIIPFVLVCVGSLGLPIAIAGWRLGLIRPWICTLVGFFLGSVPGGLFLYSTYSGGSSSSNGAQYWINGTPTLEGVIQLVIMVLIMGFLGAWGGYSFWLVWRFLTRYASNQPNRSEPENQKSQISNL